MSENPKLVNDQMKNNLYNKLARSSNMADTSTNMFVPLFANDTKLIEEDNRKEYGEYEEEYQEGGENAELDEPDKLDDDVESYREKRTKLFKHINSDVKDNFNNKTEEKKINKNSEKFQNYNDPSSENSNQPKKEEIVDDPSQWSKKEMQIKKLDMLRKLGELSQRGVKISYNYNMDSDYDTMKFEYDLHTGIRAKSNSVNWMSNMLIGIVKGVEMLNDNVNPFDIKFEGAWSSKITHDINDFQDVIGELYEKYTVPGKPMSPELKLFLMLSGSAISVQMYKGLAQSSNSTEKINSDPDKIRKLRMMADEDSNNSSERTETSSQKRHTIAKERLSKQHEDVARLATDYHTIKTSEKEYNNIQNRASKNKDLNDGLIMSESMRSVKSTGTKSTDNKLIKQFQNQPIRQKQPLNIEEFKNEIIKNQKLLEADKLLNSFEQEEKELKSATKNKIKPRELKHTENTKKIKTSSDSVSLNSSSSSIASYSNPDIDNILRPVINSQKKTKESSKSSSISSSSSVSSSSQKKGIVIDSDEIRSSDKESKTIKVKKPLNYDDRITKEMISFGKSNDSGTTGSKRGRPKKEPMKIKVGM